MNSENSNPAIIPLDGASLQVEKYNDGSYTLSFQNGNQNPQSYRIDNAGNLFLHVQQNGRTNNQQLFSGSAQQTADEILQELPGYEQQKNSGNTN